VAARGSRAAAGPRAQHRHAFLNKKSTISGQYRHGERTKTAIAEQRKLSALLKMLRVGLT